MKRVLALAVLLAFASCGKEVVYNETLKDFAENRWAIDEGKTFTMNFEHDVPSPEVYLHFSYVHEPGYDNFPVALVWQGPDGKMENIILDVKLKDGSGNSLGNCAGDVCDITMPVKKFDKLEEGSYKLMVYNKFNGEYLPNVLALGVSVEHLD
jgi:hypothetical protein